MYKRVLLLCDLEGVNHVVGVPYEGLLKGTEQWEVARRQAALELNAAADALYEAGAEIVGAGIVVEKAFQQGGELIRSQGIRVESLARVESMTDDGRITFCE